jgi:FtsP/CotA-like multicopper oxidase with cupredoxin domain
MCPGVPDPSRPAPANSPSSTPEAFMDTPVINGVAYPNLVVAPAAYRFRILNAANDRTWNLGLYVAEPVSVSPIITNPGANYITPGVTISGGGCLTFGSATAQLGSGTFNNVAYTDGIVGITMIVQPTGCTSAPSIVIADVALTPTGAGAAATAVMSTNTEVHMVPAVPAAAGRALPNCSATSSLLLNGGGQVTSAITTTTTGLPAGCWPLYTSPAGFTAGTFGESGQLSWGNSDARVGGVPDPLTAGPPIIQIGAEGGLLPQAAVIPSTPVSYDYNKRSITVLNVLNHGLLLGGAERADVVIDFTPFAGQTLILYNDAPAPVPAGDPRLDYFTNDPDNSSSGGAPSTLAGYGPNTRTIMRIQVTGANPNVTPFSLATVQANMPTLFATSQEPIIVPEAVYPAGNGAGANTYLPIQATSINAWVGGPIGSLTLTSGGAGYTAVPTVTIAPPATGTAATATAALVPTSVGSLALTSGGANYTSIPTVTIGGNGTGAKATATLSATSVASATVTRQGSGYTAVPTVTFSAPTAGTTATGTAVVSNRKVVSITITNPGSGYVIGAPPTIVISGGGGSGATATAALKGTAVASLALTAGGSGYTAATVSFSGGGGSGAAAAATITPSVVGSVTLTSAGSGYTGAPTVTFSAPQATGTAATATAAAPTTLLHPKAIQELFTLDYGRMNATLGVEVPFTNFLTQTTIPYGFVDPPTEIFKDGETQLWKITHNGVDTHFVHFHLFNVQVINRIGWDGAIKPPDPNEVGFKDTVRMNPLEDVVVALRPFKQTLPFAAPSSWRLMDPTKPAGFTSTTEFTNIDPSNNPATVTNARINFGWEYVWHCHILGHEENDMMRAMILAVAPQTPAATLASATKGRIVVTIAGVANTANVADPTGFSVYRATSAAGPFTLVGSVGATLNGAVASATFTDTGLTSKTTYYYQVVANNLVGYTQVYATGGYPTASADSAPSPTVSIAAR